MSSPRATTRRAVFLDRDGTLIHDCRYPASGSEVRLLAGAGAALRGLSDDGWKLVVVSNQSGIGRGLVSESQARDVHGELCRQLAIAAVRLDGAYYCPHAPWERCTCRKPAPGLFNEAAEALGISLRHSLVVGDRSSDITAGRRAGCRAGILITEGAPACSGFAHRARDWRDVPALVRLVARRPM